MSYSRPPNILKVGVGLIQNPPPTTLAPAGVIPVQVDAAIATTSSLGVVQVGSGLSITPSGVLSSTGGSASDGTWTPSIVSSLGATITLTTSNARYVKVGKLVTCTFDITIATETGGGNAGILTLHGLPFTSITEASGGYVGSVYVSDFINMDNDTGWLSGSVINNSTIANLWFGSAQPKSLVALTQNDIRPTTRIVGTITYLSAS